MGIPGIINAQRRADRYATVNILQTVHEACLGNAKQFGGSGAVYGFSLLYNNTTAVSGQVAATGIKPWVIETASGNTLPAAAVDRVRYATDLFAPTVPGPLRIKIPEMIGKEMMWNNDVIEFVDIYNPATWVSINGSFQPATGITGTSYVLHVAYEPRTGFIHSRVDTSARPSVVDFSAAELTKTASAAVDLTEVEIVVYKKASSGTAQKSSKFVIKKTGASDVRLP